MSKSRKQTKKKIPLIRGILGLLVIAMIAGAMLPNGRKPPEPKDLLEHEILYEDVSDTPVKTMLEMHILVPGELTEEGLRELLDDLYQRARKRSGFRYRSRISQIFIYAFSSREQQQNSTALWVAMLSWNEGNEPHLSVRETQIEAANAEPQVIFGLTEEQRREVYAESRSRSWQASEDANDRYPVDAGMDREAALERMDQQNEYCRQQREACEAEQMAEWGLTEEQLEAIFIEGAESGWPYPQ